MNDHITMESACGLDTSVFEEVIEHGPIEDRLELTRQLCALVNDPATLVAERRSVMACLTRLACDRDRDVRALLTAELALNEHLSADVVFAIVADDDDLALPFIVANPSFSAATQCAVLQVGDAPRCGAIASRADVAPAAVRKIVNEGSPETSIALLKNKMVRLGSGYCRKLYNRFHDQPKVCAALVEAPYLPAEIALVHNQRTADEMRKSAKLQGWVADFKSDDFICDNEELTALRILAEVPADKLQGLVALMSTRGMLTTSLLLRAGISGNIPFFEWALAYLATASLRRVRAATSRSSMRTANVILRRAAIPQEAHALFLSICMVASATGANGSKVDPDAFGRALVEVVMTRIAADDPDERERTVQILGQLAQGRTKTLVSRFTEDYARVA